MTAIAIFPVLVCILGLVMWFVSSNAKAAECGRIMFAAGLLVTCFELATHMIRIG